MTSAASGTTEAVARLWRGGSVPAAPAATPAASAVTLVGRLAPAWGAPGGTAELTPLATVAVGGGSIVRLRQAIDGVTVDAGELRVLVGPGGSLVAAAGTVVPADIARDRTGFKLDAAAAVARAIHELHGVDISAGLRARPAAAGARTTDDVAWFQGQVADVAVEEARARKLWHRDGNALVPAWVVEAYTSSDDSTDGLAYRMVIGARDGRVLARRDLTVDAFNYRVWADTTADYRPWDGPVSDFSPHPSGTPGAARPPFVAPSLISVTGLNNRGGGTPDPWLTDDATETTGNNVDAYTDINSPTGLSEGDFRASVTSAGNFDRVYDTAVSPIASNAQQQAAITQLFYSINWLHDDWYDAGFTEAAGNGQVNNFGRGGTGGDALRAEAQDGANAGNRNNANMSTPDDGMAPRMQVYLWSGAEDRTLTVQPTNRVPATRPASYGPPNYDLTDDLVLGTDGTGVSMGDGCEALTNAAAVAGKIVLLERGNCTGKRKALNAQTAGAVGVVIAHNVVNSPAPGLPNDTAITDAITIPAMSVGYDDGVALRADLTAGAVSMVMHRRVGVESDGALDGGLVAHEFGHYLHHRLSLCGTAQCGGMSEGWADFLAMHMMARSGDNLAGVYSLSGYAFNGDPYFGIRRVPYSTDLRKNAVTFGMVADGVPLPTSHPTSGGGPNSEVHNAGEVWATILWEGYIALQQERGTATFDEVRRKMMRYIVGGLLMAPPDGTFTEIRDSILAATQAASPADHTVLAAAFARRGLGSCAVSPARTSDDFLGTVESFDVRGHAATGVTSLAVDVTDCDEDSTLDVGETATITVPVVNSGAAALANLTVTVATTTPGLTVVTAPVSIAALAPYASATATFQVRLDAATGPAAGMLDVTIASPGACTETRSIAMPVRLAADDQAAASATDSMDAAGSPWTPTGEDATVAWKLASTTALDRYWHGADLGTTSDTMLVSPALIAGPGTVAVVLNHAFQFELGDDGIYYDGGVIEISTDDGATWADVSTLTTVAYNATLGGESGNPLGGQTAFGGTNPAYPSTDQLTLDFGTQLAGKTFRLRFRIGTDAGVGAAGWSIDDLQVVGITNTPFPVQGADADACNPDVVDPAGPDGDGGGCCSTGGGRGTDLAAGLLVAALVVRRRRRRA